MRPVSRPQTALAHWAAVTPEYWSLEPVRWLPPIHPRAGNSILPRTSLPGQSDLGRIAFDPRRVSGPGVLQVVWPGNDHLWADKINCNAEYSVEPLTRLKTQLPHVAEKRVDGQANEALVTLERYASEGFQARKTPLWSGAWGQPLAYRKGNRR